MEVSYRVEMLPKYVTVCLSLQDLDGRGFGGLLSRTAVHAVAGMGKAREQHNKGNLVAKEVEFHIWFVS
jgi:hypothetical protein